MSEARNLPWAPASKALLAMHAPCKREKRVRFLLGALHNDPRWIRQEKARCLRSTLQERNGPE
jgi:hypothetical protein